MRTIILTHTYNNESLNTNYHIEVGTKWPTLVFTDDRQPSNVLKLVETFCILLLISLKFAPVAPVAISWCWSSSGLLCRSKISHIPVQILLNSPDQTLEKFSNLKTIILSVCRNCYFGYRPGVTGGHFKSCISPVSGTNWANYYIILDWQKWPQETDPLFHRSKTASSCLINQDVISVHLMQTSARTYEEVCTKISHLATGALIFKVWAINVENKWIEMKLKWNEDTHVIADGDSPCPMVLRHSLRFVS